MTYETRQSELAALLDACTISASLQPKPDAGAYVIPGTGPIFGFATPTKDKGTVDHINITATAEKNTVKVSDVQPQVGAITAKVAQTPVNVEHNSSKSMDIITTHKHGAIANPGGKPQADTPLGQPAKQPASHSGGASSTTDQVVDSDSDDDSVDYDQPEDPFYDDGADNEDEIWVAKQLQPQSHTKRSQAAAAAGTNLQAAGENTDAFLSCPCCFTTLCIQCQKHTKYENQWRAVTAANCRIAKDSSNREEKQQQVADQNVAPSAPAPAPVQCEECESCPAQVYCEKCGTSLCSSCNVESHETIKQNIRDPLQLDYTEADGQGHEFKQPAAAAPEVGPDAQEQADKEEVYYPVMCDECGVQVGVQDVEEIYHFYNVVPSSV